jgi:hypothetical protein
MPAKKFWPSLSVNSKKKNCNPYFIVKTQNYFVIFYYTERLPQVIYVQLASKQTEMKFDLM